MAELIRTGVADISSDGIKYSPESVGITIKNPAELLEEDDALELLTDEGEDALLDDVLDTLLEDEDAEETEATLLDEELDASTELALDEEASDDDVPLDEEPEDTELIAGLLDEVELLEPPPLHAVINTAANATTT